MPLPRGIPGMPGGMPAGSSVTVLPAGSTIQLGGGVTIGPGGVISGAAGHLPPISAKPGGGGPMGMAGADGTARGAAGGPGSVVSGAGSTMGGPPPFGALHIVVSGCKNLPKLLADQAERCFIRGRVGEQRKATGLARESGARPRFGDELIFDLRAEREIELQFCRRDGASAEDGGLGAAPAAETILATAKTNILSWVAQGSFVGDIDFRDPTGQPCGSIMLDVKFEKNLLHRPEDLPGMPASAAAGGAAASAAGSEGAAPSIGAASVRDPNGLFTDDEIKEAFNAFDLDKNKFIGAAEIRHILINIGEMVTDDEVDEMIRMCDRDGDGQVSFPEFYRMVSGGKEPPARLFSKVEAVSTVPPLDLVAAMGGKGAAAPEADVDPAALMQQRNARRNALEAYSRDYNVDADQVKKSFDTFLEADKAQLGVVDLPGFCDLLEVDTGPVVERLFQLYDPEKTGKIDFRQFIVALLNFTTAPKEDRIRFTFDVFDINKDGFINKEELTLALKSNHLSSSTKEVVRKVETMLAQAVGGSDGMMSFEEFVRICGKFPNLIHPSYGMGSKALAARGKALGDE